MLDLDIARYIDRYLRVGEVNDETLGLDLIQQVKIGGSFIAEEHTARNFRRYLRQPALFDRGMSQGLGQERGKDALAAAHEQWRAVLAKAEPYRVSPEKEREIDRIVAAAERLL
jgi:trimethylamine:corrinoid methyltransferase-like protein